MFTLNRIKKLDNGMNIKAFADIIYDGKILIKGIKIIEVNTERFIRMPDEKSKDGKWYATITILDVILRKELETLLLSEYDKLV